MPEAVSAEINEALDDTGRSIAAKMRSRAPMRRGALRAGLLHKVFPKTLKLQVGLLGTKAGRSKLFYARILDLGRKARSVQVSRFARGARASGAGFVSGGKKRGAVSSYTMNVKAIKPMRFVTGSYRDLREGLTRRLKDIWDRALTSVAEGGE